MSEETIVNCPTCGKTVVWGEQSPFRPFCSKRCQLIDLGEWAAEVTNTFVCNIICILV